MLSFDGRIHHLERGFWLKFEFARVEVTSDRMDYATALRCTMRAEPDCLDLTTRTVRWRRAVVFENPMRPMTTGIGR